MSETFDKKLIRRLGEVFDNPPETFDKGAWKRMEKRLRKENGRDVNYLPMVMRAAAIVLLLLLLFAPFQINITEQGMEKQTNKLSEQKPPAAFNHQEENAQKEVYSEQEQLSQPPEPVEQMNKNQKGLAANLPESEKSDGIKKTDTDINTAERLMVNRYSKLSARFEGLEGESTNKIGRRELGMLSSVTKPEWPSATEQELKRKNVSFSVSLSSLYNYTPQKTKSQFNYSGGFKSDISITSNLSLNTGLIVAKQYFSTQSEQSPVLNALSERSESLGKYTLSGEDHFELIGLDLPVNMSYQYKNLTFTAGVSSVFYIQEQISAEFNSSLTDRYELDLTNNPNLVKQNNEVLYQEKIRAFETLDLISTLNLSIGYSFDWYENDFLIEPYIKHPLGDMTHYNIRYGSRGLRLIYIF